MARSFVERWFVDHAACDVFWNDELSRFEVVSGERVLFDAPALVDVLRWGMGLPVSAPPSVHGDARAIELSGSDALEALVAEKF